MSTDISAPINSFALIAQVEVWRQKVRDKTITKEELTQAFIALRQSRGTVKPATGGSATTKRASTAKAKAPPKSGEDLLSALDNL